MDRKELCKKYDISQSTMLRIASENNIKNNAIKNSENLTKKLAELKSNGVHIKELAKMFNMKESAIYARINSYKKCRD